MIDLVKKFFNKSSKENAETTETDVTHDIRIATCAILLEMANIDGEFSESEKDHILTRMRDDFQLSEDTASELMNAAQKELDESIDLWRFTNLINQNYSLEEKISIIEMIWNLAYHDGRLDQHEDYLMHKLQNLLRLNHKQLIDAKLKVIKKV